MTLSRLDAVLSAATVYGADDALCERLAAELDDLFRTLPATEVVLAAARERVDRWRSSLAEDSRQAWWQHKVANLKYPGDPTVGLRVVCWEVETQVENQVDRLHYRVVRARHAGDACDCATLRELGATHLCPTSPRLTRERGGSTDSYYLGDLLVCGVCGARWNENVGDDDVGSLFWEPADQ